MNIVTISSASNPQFKRLKSLSSRSGRRKEGCFLLEGPKVITEARSRSVEIDAVAVSASSVHRGEFDSTEWTSISSDLRIFELSDNLFALISETETPQGVLAVVRCRTHGPESLFARAPGLVVIVDAVQDPGNLGTIFRTAQGLNATGLVLTRGTVDPYNAKVVRAASGAILSLPFILNLDLEEAIALCKRQGQNVVALAPGDGSTICQVDWSKPSALILGNEGQGIPRELLNHADQVVSIPLNPNCESLNVGVTAAIALYEAARQRQFRCIE
ncbi:MAG: RNA methyltransferase [Cyanobacteria bacterium]|nr:RNA methyltransferase [Cyanobacteriota bacterium]